MDQSEVQSTLTEMLPGLNAAHFRYTDRPLSSLMNHTLRQGVAAAVMRLDPNIVRQAVSSDPTWADIYAWLEATPAVPASDREAAQSRSPRGSYRSTSAMLRPISPPDVEALYRASTSPKENHRWRFRGRTPGPADFQQLLFGGDVLSQFMVVEIASGRPIGLVVAYNSNLPSGHVFLAMQRLLPEDTPSSSSGLMVEGFFIFAQYLFDHFPLQKLYLEVPEYNMSLIEGGAGSMLEVEGRLRDHQYWGDRTWDQYILALYRQRWEGVADAFRGVWPEDHFKRTELEWQDDPVTSSDPSSPVA